MMMRRRTAAVLVALVGVPLVALASAILVVFFFGVSIDASPWREALAARASAALGRPVTLAGPLELRLGRETALLAHDLRVASPPGFAVPELVTFGTASLRVDLLSALRGRLHVHGLELADIRVRLVRYDDGRANWLPSTLSSDASGTRRASGPVEMEVERLSIRNLVVEYQNGRSKPRRLLELEDLAGRGKWGKPLQLTARIRTRGSVRCSVDIVGAPARDLQKSDRPWPLTLDVACPDTRLHADGALEAGREAARFIFGAGTRNLGEVERLFEQELPSFRGAAFTGNVVVTARAIEVAELHGVLGDTEVMGALSLGFDGVQPRLSGDLAVATLDLRPFLYGERKQDEPVSRDQLEHHPLSLRGPVPVDADVRLRVQHLLGVAVEVRDARLTLRADERGVHAPVEATVAGVRLAGRIELDTAAPTPAFALEVGVQDVSRAGFLTGAPGIEGRVGRAALRLGGRGATLDELVRDLDMRLEIADARMRTGESAGGRPFEVALDAFQLVALHGEPVRGTAQGKLLGKPVRLTLRGGEVEQMLRELATPLEVELRTPGATARLSGMLARPGTARGTDLSFRLDAPHAGRLAGWLGVAPEAQLPVTVRSRARFERDHWRLEDTTLEVGRSKLTFEARRAFVDGRSVAVVALRSPLIDVPELQTLRARSAAAPGRRLATLIDVPILPRGIELADADVHLDLVRVELGRAELAEVELSARIRDGRLPPSPWRARVAGVPFEGRVALDLRGQVPEMSLSMSAQEVDVGALLRTLRVAEIIDERAARLHVELAGRGSSLADLLDHLSLQAHLAGGELTVRGPASRPVARIRVEEIVVGALPGEPVTVRVDGALNETPTAITVSSGTLADFARQSAHMPFSVEAKAAGARLALDGQVTLPLGRGGKLTLELAGERLDSLRGLARAELPPWGPWSIRGPFSMTPTGYEVRQLVVRVGESRLYGRGSLDLTGARPFLHASIRAPTVQLDDFPFEARLAAERSTSRIENLRATARGAAGQTEALLSRAFLRRFDASVKVEVQQVLSGADRLVDGRLHVELIDGRLDVDPLEVNLPGGGARLYGSYDTRGREVALAAGARIERFEYGVLARRSRPDADIQGLLSLDMGIRGTAPSLDSIFAHADGYFDFAVWPKNLRGGVFDRWSVNMFLALLPVLDPGTESRVNCFVGRLDLNDGVLTHDALIIDTTRVRALGAGSANLRTEEIAFRFRPRAKGAAFFSLQTPLTITGTMTDFKVAPTRGDFFEAFARLFTSVITLPLETLIHGPLPLDGADVCTDPLRAGGAAAQ
jgi:uncharacterized protein involved in outer membrane biogenesis